MLPIALAATAEAASSDPQQLLFERAEQQWESLPTDAIRDYLQELQRRSDGLLEPLSAASLRGLIRGEGFPYGPDQLLSAALRLLFGGILDHLDLLGQLVLLAVLLAVLQLLRTAFAGETVGNVAAAVVYLAVAVVALVAFIEAMRSVQDVIGSLVGFMLAILPLLITLLAGVGAFVSAGVLSPLAVLVVNAVGLIVNDWVIPLLFLGTLLEIVNHLPGRIKVGQLAGLIRRAGMIVLSLSLLVFLGVMTVQGAASGVSDGVLVRTAKYTAGTFIPVLGGMFADAVELVIGSSLLLKKAVGVLGLLVVTLLAALPLLKVLALILTFHLAAALVQPIADGPLVRLLGALGNGLTLIGLAAGAVTLMFFLTLTIVIGAGTAAVMLR